MSVRPIRRSTYEGARPGQAGDRPQRQGPRVKADRFGRRPRQHQDGDEPVLRDRRRRGGAHEGRRASSPARSSSSRSARRRRRKRIRIASRHGRRPRHPRADRRRRRAAAVAKILRGSSRPRSPTWSSLGKQAIDDDNNADRPDARRPARLAAGDVRLEASPSAGDKPKVTREVDGGLQTVSTSTCRRSSPPTCA